MTVCIILLTYAPDANHPRAQYARKTLTSALHHVKTSHDLYVHISDDGSGQDHINMLENICIMHGTSYTVSNAQRSGYGASYNLATQVCHGRADYFLVLEDDWELVHELDLDPLIKALEEGELGCIRLGYIGWTQELTGTIIKAGDRTYLKFNPSSAEPHVWAGHPRFETVAFQRKIGPWPEGLNPGTTEFTVAKREEAREGVGWPMDMDIRASQTHASLFAHIGAVQAREDQVEVPS